MTDYKVKHEVEVIKREKDKGLKIFGTVIVVLLWAAFFALVSTTLFVFWEVFVAAFLLIIASYGSMYELFNNPLGNEETIKKVNHVIEEVEENEE